MGSKKPIYYLKTLLLLYYLYAMKIREKYVAKVCGPEKGRWVCVREIALRRAVGLKHVYVKETIPSKHSRKSILVPIDFDVIHLSGKLVEFLPFLWHSRTPFAIGGQLLHSAEAKPSASLAILA